MSCSVYIYDDHLNPEPSATIEILETDSWGTKIDLSMNGPLHSGQFGATLISPTLPAAVDIWVDDTSGHFAPASLGHLHGTASVELHVTLYPLPLPSGGYGGGGGGGGYGYGTSQRTLAVGRSDSDRRPQTPAEISTYIASQVSSRKWNQSQAAGVRNLVNAVIRAISLPRRAPELDSKVGTWRARLQGLGIEIALQSAISSSGSSSPASHAAGA